MRRTNKNSPINSVLNKRYHLEALGNKYKDLYEFIPQSFEMIRDDAFCLGPNFNISKVGYCKYYALHSTSGPCGGKKLDAASPCWRAFQKIK